MFSQDSTSSAFMFPQDSMSSHLCFKTSMSSIFMLSKTSMSSIFILSKTSMSSTFMILKTSMSSAFMLYKTSMSFVYMLYKTSISTSSALMLQESNVLHFMFCRTSRSPVWCYRTSMSFCFFQFLFLFSLASDFEQPYLSNEISVIIWWMIVSISLEFIDNDCDCD